MSFYKRNLPHWQPGGAEFFITFRLAGSLPKEAVNDLKRQRSELEKCSPGCQPGLRAQIQKRIFQGYETLLDQNKTGPTWLRKQEIAEIVKEAIHYRDESEYDLYAYTIMPNHVHLVFKHLNEDGIIKHQYPITEILRELKRFTARECNKLLNRTGGFWQAESYDRVIRNAKELENTIAYTLHNPVKAGLVNRWEDWPYNYCKP